MGTIDGKIVRIGETGEAISDIALDQLADVPRDDRVSIHCEGHVTVQIFAADHGQPEMTFIAYLGNSECLELALVGDDIQTFLGIKPGCDVQIKW